MNDSTHDKVEGTLHEAKGAIKEKIGQKTNNPDLEAEGNDETFGDKIQNKIGDIKKVFEK